MNTKQFIKDYLTFSKKDRLGIYIILGLILIIYLLPAFFSKTQFTSPSIDTTLAKIIDTVQLQQKDVANRNIDNYSTSFSHEPSIETNFTKGTLFVFDPNTLSAEGWKKLGLGERTIRTILNYRNKGGKFYKPEDLQKIWGLPQGFYEYVAGHIQITSVQRNYERTYTNTYNQYEKKETRIAVVDINNADTSAYIALPGIGSKLAARIINFREKLGGFHSVEQIKETYGLPDSTFQIIKTYLQVSNSTVKKFNLNTATKEELKAHPYIKWQLANAIVEYRNQHGLYKTIEDLQKILIIDEETFGKIAPYFTL